MWENYYPEELYHHGVKGMKWGVRRFRNKDGSLTSAGRKRYGDEATSGPVNTSKKQRRSDAKAAYRRATSNAFSKYEKEIADIEKSYKRGQNLSKTDLARQDKAESNYQKSVSKAKNDYKQFKRTERANAKAERILAKNEKAKYKETIKQYRKEINAGESFVGRVYNKLTDADRYEAELRYYADKRRS